MHFGRREAHIIMPIRTPNYVYMREVTVEHRDSHTRNLCRPFAAENQLPACM